ncbi:hypothetical protein DWY77_02760 [Megamonas rupellensis]|uniref:Uncharacterized protein n=1 Tax=Megamonas rupellensis TaxID=491921 RepID=A0A412CGE9_9FIRM|nr:hypothetical protein [Megamonas rupellensis]RGQ85546.1 hypothetical protein DWY77_02760 [Megamonas rupellensis]
MCFKIIFNKGLFPEIDDIIKNDSNFNIEEFSNSLFKLSKKDEKFFIEPKNLDVLYKIAINEKESKIIASTLIRIIKGIFTVIFHKKSIINKEIEDKWYIYTEKTKYVKDILVRFFVPYKGEHICKMVNDVNKLANLSVNNIHIAAALLIWGLDYRVGVDYGKIIEILEEDDTLKNDNKFKDILSNQEHINLKRIKKVLNMSINPFVGRHLNDTILSKENESNEKYTLDDIENMLFKVMDRLLELEFIKQENAKKAPK